ncbi:MAG: putative baseplate assembly protein [Vicinamibacterales bacterium]
MANDTRHCDCCQTGLTPRQLYNPPGASTLVYRVAPYGHVLPRMLEQLSREHIEDAPNVLRYPLTGLATRDLDDPAIALLDAWAVVGDVLSFYQERIANEGYLRTATERRSILELAGLIGYQLSPGVAASVHLAFDVDEAVGAPTTAVVPAGMRVQSVPGQNELPQPFETAEAITARVEWNHIAPRQLRPQELAISSGKLMMLGLSVGLGASATDVDVTAVHPLDLDTGLPATGTVKAAEVNTIYLSGTNVSLKAGDVVVLVGKKNTTNATEQTLPKVVRSVEAQDALNRTRIDFEGPQPKPLDYSITFNRAATVSLQATSLSSASANAVAGATFSEQALGAFGAVQGWGMASLASYYYKAYSVTEPRTKLPPAAPGAFAMRARAGFFGHNAPTLIAQAGTGGMVAQDLSSTQIWRTGQTDCYLERTVAGVTDNSWMVLELAKQLTAFRITTANEASLAEFGLSGKATGLVLDASATKSSSFVVRQTTAHVQSERLVLVQLPIEAEIGKGTAEEGQLTLDRMVLNLHVGQAVALSGERADLPGVSASEIATLQDIRHSGGFTTLFFVSPGLQHRYVRHTVTLNANVARATHGETVYEVLGSGSGSTPRQRFALKRSPLTYTASTSESGAASALQLRVNGLLWSEAPRLVDQDGASERFIVRIADDGKASVIFGDGEHGARLPSGVENVTATYRTGIGAPGMVGADRITLMTTRPLGIRAATNPLPSSGAADAESADLARSNAPLTVTAMGRVVSLRDAEDFARAFAGIGKARATSLWRAGTQWVHLTIAASVALPIEPGATTVLPDYRVDLSAALGTNLAAALDTFKEPSMRLRLDTYQPLYFDVHAKVAIDLRVEWSQVEAALRRALIASFSFDARAFGQAVTVADVVRVVHSVDGVVFVDIDVLRRFDQTTPDLPVTGALPADNVQWADSESAPVALAQLLLINPLGISLTRI